MLLWHYSFVMSLSYNNHDSSHLTALKTTILTGWEVQYPPFQKVVLAMIPDHSFRSESGRERKHCQIRRLGSK